MITFPSTFTLNNEVSEKGSFFTFSDGQTYYIKKIRAQEIPGKTDLLKI